MLEGNMHKGRQKNCLKKKVSLPLLSTAIPHVPFHMPTSSPPLPTCTALHKCHRVAVKALPGTSSSSASSWLQGMCQVSGSTTRTAMCVTYFQSETTVPTPLYTLQIQAAPGKVTGTPSPPLFSSHTFRFCITACTMRQRVAARSAAGCHLGHWLLEENQNYHFTVKA